MVPIWLRKMWFRAWFAAEARWRKWLRRPAHGGPLGPWGEAIARRHLLCNGYYIVAQNERTSFGEIDLIAVDRRRLVFVEVKTLAGADQDLPSDRVDEEKQDHISKSATEYRRHRNLEDVPARFDVIAIWAETDEDGPRVKRLRHFLNAFESTCE